MFNLSGSELVFLVLIALVVLGPDKLPEAMRKAGKAYADFKKMTSGFQSEMRSVLDEPMRELRETAELAKKAASWDTNMLDPRATPAAAPDTKPVSASMADHTPAAVSTPVGEPDAAPVSAPVPEPAAAASAASEPADATSRRLQSSAAEPEVVAAAAKPFSPNFSSAAPRVTPAAETTPETRPDTTEFAAE